MVPPQVACTQLGFAGGMVGSFKAGKPLPIRVGRLMCLGNETRLDDCSMDNNGWATACTEPCYDNCQNLNFGPAGVICRGELSSGSGKELGRCCA